MTGRRTVWNWAERLGRDRVRGRGEEKPMDRIGIELQDRVMQLRIQCLCIDTADPAQLAAFWQKARGWRRTFEQDHEVVLEPLEANPEDGVVPDLLFLRVPEEKAGKNRPHLDLRHAGPGGRGSAA
jgi:hypothetical protein